MRENCTSGSVRGGGGNAPTYSADVFNRVEFGAFGRQRDDADVIGDDKLSGHVPPGLIHQHDRVGARGDGERYLGQVQRHGFGIAEWEDEPGALAVFRAYRAEDVGRFRPLVFRRRWPRPASGPPPRDLVLRENDPPDRFLVRAI